jgi:hypothetical protein
MTSNLTEGNKRIREIIYEHLEYYQDLASQPNNQEKYGEIYLRVRNQISSDPVIRLDARTSQSLHHHEISDNYLNWLYFNNPRQVLYGGTHQVKLDRFVYRPTFAFDPKSGEDMFAYQGGHKANSTVSCLFGLANDEKLTKWGWTFTYFTKEEILRCNEGHHRLLANVLWGNQDISPEQITVVDELVIDWQLHETLLKIEGFLREYNLFFTIESGFRRNWNYLEEAADIKTYFGKVRLDEMKIVGDFANPENHNSCNTYFEGRTLNIYNFTKLFEELKKFRSRPVLEKATIYIRRKLGHFNESSHFNEWLSENIDRYY